MTKTNQKKEKEITKEVGRITKILYPKKDWKKDLERLEVSDIDSEISIAMSQHDKTWETVTFYKGHLKPFIKNLLEAERKEGRKEFAESIGLDYEAYMKKRYDIKNGK